MRALDGRKVAVVGGGSGIGRATALLAAEAGADVVIGGRTAAKLDAVAREAASGRISASVVDHTDPVSVERFAATVGPLDHLVVTASAGVHGSFAEVPIERVRQLFESKLFGPWRVVRALLPQFREGGTVTLFSGVLSRRPGPGTSALAAVNAAVEGLVRALAVELGPRLRVNGVSPGMIRSEAYAAMPEDAREAMYVATGESLPVGRVGVPEEVARAVLFLIGDGYMTGHVLDIDGGHLIRHGARRAGG